jgi:hypothetical protein
MRWSGIGLATVERLTMSLGRAPRRRHGRDVHACRGQRSRHGQRLVDDEVRTPRFGERQNVVGHPPWDPGEHQADRVRARSPGDLPPHQQRMAENERAEHRADPNTGRDVPGVETGSPARAQSVASGGQQDLVPSLLQRTGERDQRQDMPHERRGDHQRAHTAQAGLHWGAGEGLRH